jgi:hypothetical protein
MTQLPITQLPNPRGPRLVYAVENRNTQDAMSRFFRGARISEDHFGNAYLLIAPDKN